MVTATELPLWPRAHKKWSAVRVSWIPRVSRSQAIDKSLIDSLSNDYKTVVTMHAVLCFARLQNKLVSSFLCIDKLSGHIRCLCVRRRAQNNELC